MKTKKSMFVLVFDAAFFIRIIHKSVHSVKKLYLLMNFYYTEIVLVIEDFNYMNLYIKCLYC